MDLKSAREKRKLTQEQLEARSGIPQTTISDIERGVIKKPSWETVSRLSKALRYAPEEVFPLEEAAAS